MEDILSSIKRIIAEDGDDSGQTDVKSAQRRELDRESRRKAVVASLAKDVDEGVGASYVDEVLELTDEMPRVGRAAIADQGADQEESAFDLTEISDAMEASVPEAAPAQSATIVSVESEMATRTSLAALSSMIVKPAEGSDNTLEGMVREMLRPMLKEWLDANLPTLVEGMVAKEIARITGRSL